MSTSSWQRIFEIFEEAAELPADARPAYLDRACAGSAEVRRGVEDLLAVEQRGDAAFEGPLAGRPWVEETASDAGARRADPPPAEAPAAGEPAASSPDRVGPYRLLRRVGQGGMSTVYLAVRSDDAFKRQVVVKLVRRGMESAGILRRLRTERQILAGLDHPYIARLFDGGSTDDGLPYFVLEYVDGVPIDAYCKHNQLGLGERLVLFRKVCAAVHYAHQNLVVHRDIKPSNILVTADGDPKLLDFGIAKLLNPDLASAESEPTATWQRILTPSYASPEQLRGRHVTTASDVYSLGVLLYKLLTGRLPRSFKGRTQEEIEELLTDTDPLPPSAAVAAADGPAAGSPPPDAGDDAEGPAAGQRTAERARRLRNRLSGDLDAIVLKALRSAPPQRYGSVEQLADDLERFERGLPVNARAGNWRYRTGKFVRRHKTAVAVAAAVAALLVAFAAAMVWQSARVLRERDQARFERDGKQAVLGLVLDVFRLADPYVQPGEELTVREALARSVPVLEAGLLDQPAVRAELLATSGAILTALGGPGAYTTAADQLEEALALRRRQYGEDHPAVVDSLVGLAAARKVLGEYDVAEELASRAVEIARGLGGRPDGRLATALSELVSVRCFRAEYEAAEAPAREMLALVDSQPEREHMAALALQALALIASADGDYRESAERNRQALARLRKLYGERHPIQLHTLNNLGLALRRQEELDAAETVYRELIDLQRENFGDDFRDPVTLANLAGVLFARGDYAGAEELFHQARDAVLETSGGDHWMVFACETAAAHCRIRQGAPVEGEKTLRTLLERWRPELGDDHRRVAQAEGILGESLSLQGRFEEAEPLLVASFRRLLESPRQRHRQDAFERLRDHLERSGKRREIARFEAMLSSSSG